jgi:cytoskeletal protein CcmA (bactofilin family)
MNNTGSGLWYPTFVISGSNSQSLYVNSASFQYNATTNTLSTTASWAITASSAISSSYSFNATSASYALTASYVLQAVSASFATLAQTANTASYVATASYASNADLLDGVHLSILATTGSNTFKADQTISGSVNVTGSISLTGSLNILGSISASAFSGSHFGTSSWALNALTASYVTSSNVYGPNGSNSILSSSYSLTASYAANGGTLTNALTFGTGLSGSASTFNGSAAVTVAISGSTTLSTNSLPKWTGTGLANSNVSDNGTVVTIATSASISAGGLNVTGNSTFQNNLIVTGDLSVAGTASFTNVDNLTIRDKFILINSGSSTLADSGWVTQYNAAGSGSAFYLEAGAAGDHGTYGRFAVAYDVIGTSTALNPNEYAVTVKVSASATPPTAPTWGGATNGSGNMYINSGNGDIYIYA